MSVSRRGFLQGLGVGRTSHAAAFMAARGHEELMAEAMQQGRQGAARVRPNLPPGVEAIRISSNENPLGPGKAAIDAILGKFPEANRYPFNSTPLDADLEILIAKLNNAKRENVVLGVGSQELLKNSARVFMSPTTAILIDEAYSDYASDPGFSTAFPLALSTPGVVVARTFSKAYGMAGVRIGYAIGDAATIKKMMAWRMPYNVNTFGVAAAVASLKDPQHIKEESARNKAVRDFTIKALADMGYT